MDFSEKTPTLLPQKSFDTPVAFHANEMIYRIKTEGISDRLKIRCKCTVFRAFQTQYFGVFSIN